MLLFSKHLGLYLGLYHGQTGAEKVPAVPLSCDWAEEALSQCRPLCLKQRLLPSICPFPSMAESTPVPSTEPTTHSHLPGDLQSPSPASEGPVFPLVPLGAGDTHVTKAADATCSPDSVTSAMVQQQSLLRLLCWRRSLSPAQL